MGQGKKSKRFYVERMRIIIIIIIEAEQEIEYILQGSKSIATHIKRAQRDLLLHAAYCALQYFLLPREYPYI